MTLDKDETPLRLDVWVFQEDIAACVAVQRNFPKRDRWETNPDPDQDHTGGKPFVAGPATGMALLVSRRDDGRIESFQWKQGIVLLGGPVGPDHSDH
jgi:hypothetical protein